MGGRPFHFHSTLVAGENRPLACEYDYDPADWTPSKFDFSTFADGAVRPWRPSGTVEQLLRGDLGQPDGLVLDVLEGNRVLVLDLFYGFD